MADAAYKKKLNVATASTGPWSLVDSPDPSLNTSRDILEINTTGGDSWKKKITGLGDWSISGTAYFDNTNTALTAIRTAFINGSDLFIQYLPTGDSSVGFTGKVVVESFEISGDVSAVEMVNFSLQGNDDISVI